MSIIHSQFEELPSGKILFNGKLYKNARSASSAEWASRNPDQKSQTNKKYRFRNADLIASRKKLSPDYAIKNRKRVRAWQLLNPEKVRASRLKNRAVIIEQKAKFRAQNREALRQKQREYRLKRPEVARHCNARRRAKMRSGLSNTELIQAIYVLASSPQKKSCYYCKRAFTIPIHVDHVVPLAKGGLHDVSNLCLSCPACNLSKGAKLPAEFMVGPQLIMGV